MTTNDNAANEAVFDHGGNVRDVDIDGVAVAAVRMYPSPRSMGQLLLTLVLPDLLRRRRGHERTPVTVEVLAACSRADRVLPAIDEPLLVPAVAKRVNRALLEHNRDTQPTHRKPSDSAAAHDRQHQGEPQ